MKKIVYIFIMAIIGNYSLFAQTTVATAELDTNNVLIGEQVKLLLKFNFDSDLNIIWPQIPDSIGKIEILSKSKIDTIIANKIKTLKQTIVVTSFDSGQFEIPPLTFLYEKQGFDTPYPVNTNQLFLNFATVKVDTALPIRDIKGPIDIPLSMKEILMLVLYGLGIVLVVYLIYIIFKKITNRHKPQKVEAPKIPPHLFALDELRRLDAEKLWQKGDVKQYHIRLTDIIRDYLCKRYDVNALEMTTDEILGYLKNIRQINYDQLKQILQLGDLAKFAKFEPLAQENIDSMKNAYDFVASTFEIEGQSIYVNDNPESEVSQ